MKGDGLSDAVFYVVVVRVLCIFEVNSEDQRLILPLIYSNLFLSWQFLKGGQEIRRFHAIFMSESAKSAQRTLP
jgi:hypothetical protein